jgi:hypothetical protein
VAARGATGGDADLVALVTARAIAAVLADPAVRELLEARPILRVLRGSSPFA